MEVAANKLKEMSNKQLVALALSLYGAEQRKPSTSVPEKIAKGDLTPSISPASSVETHVRSGWVGNVLSAPEVLRHKMVLDHVRETIAGALERGEVIAPDTPLNQVGMDSLIAVEIQERLSRAYEIELNAGAIYNFADANQIADFLLGQIQNVKSEPAVELLPTQKDKNEPIAIIGLSCRFPGGSNSKDEYWQMLLNGQDAVTEMTTERWSMRDYFDPDPSVPGKMYSKWAGLIDSVKSFDAEFFGISRDEAKVMDPQQRLLLEMGWEAIERAGYSVSSLRGCAGGIYIGAVNSEYAQLQSRMPDSALNGYMGTGNATSVLAGRLAFHLGFEGPAMVVDTACSSSLVSVDLACQSLRSGKTNLALAGGINLNINPQTNIILSKAMMLSSDGRCKAFDHKANGYVRSEGAGVLMLKRLSDAERDGDDIIAVIRGGAVNQDGRSQGLTAPNAQSQQEVLKAALKSAGLQAKDVDYIEAHGTGTALGDPVEVSAIDAVFSGSRDSKLLIGSVKSNIGHTEAAAGVAGLIKAAMIAKHRVIPCGLHIEKLNEKLKYNTDALEILTHQKEIHNKDSVNVGVSSFGMSGTNAHLIVSTYHKKKQSRSIGKSTDRKLNILTVSAKNNDSLYVLLDRFAKQLKQVDDRRFLNLCLSSNLCRDHFTARFASQAKTISEALEDIKQHQINISSGKVEVPEIERSVFVFSAQGAQYENMGRDLYYNFPAFRESFDKCENIFQQSMGISIKTIMWSGDIEEIHDHKNALAATFSFEYALAQLWMSWKVFPDMVCGKGVGELAAACIAGVFNLEDACRLISLQTMCIGKNADSDHMLNEFLSQASVIRFSKPKIALISSMNGERGEASIETALYWWEQFSNESSFDQIPSSWFELENSVLYEIGPSDTLIELINRAENSNFYSIVSQMPEVDGFEQIQQAVKKSYLLNSDIQWKEVHGETEFDRVELPVYAFKQDEHWVDVDPMISLGSGAGKAVAHPLLGTKMNIALPGFQTTFSLTKQEYFKDHKVMNICLVPGSTYIEIGFAVAKSIFESDSARVNDLKILEPLPMDEADQGRLVQIHTHPIDENRHEYSVYSSSRDSNYDDWRLNAKGIIEKADLNPTLITELSDLKRDHTQTFNCDSLYKDLANIGLQYGPCHQGVKLVYLNAKSALTLVDLTSRFDDAESYDFHPSVLDSCFHPLAPLLFRNHGIKYDIFVPISAEQIELFYPLSERVWCYAELVDVSQIRVVANFVIYSESGNVCARINQVRFRKASYSNIVSQIRKSHKELYYRTSWHEESLTVESGVEFANKNILIFDDGGNFSSEIAERLRRSNSVISVTLSDHYYEEIDSNMAGVNPVSSQDFSKLFLRLSEAGRTPDYIINAWPLVEAGSITTTNSIASCGMLNLVQSCVKSGVKPEKVVVITGNTQAVSNKDVIHSIEGAAVWGLAKVVSAEHAELNLKKYDIDLDELMGSVDQLEKELGMVVDEDSVAFRGSSRYVAYLESTDIPRNKNLKAVHFEPEASYLVTGGLGSLGLNVAHWMAERGAKTIILSSRSKPNRDAEEIIDAIRNIGCNVIPLQCDISNQNQVNEMLATCAKNYAPIRGVIHAAGVLDDGILLQQNWDRFEGVYRAKVYGGWNLHQSLSSEDLDFTIYFSSAASLLGTPGQSNYAAANSFLDSLAHYRTSKGLPTLSINWGPWSEIGMSTSSVVKSRIEKEDIVRMVSPKIAMQCFEQAFEVLQSGTKLSQLGVVSINWVNLTKSFRNLGIEPKFFSRLLVDQEEDNSSNNSFDAQSFNEAYLAVSEGEKKAFLESYIHGQVVKVIGTDESLVIGLDESLFDVGLDSLMAVDLRNILGAILGEQVSVTLLFDYGTISALAEYVFDKLSAEEETKPEGNKTESHLIEIRRSRKQIEASQSSPLFFVHAVGGSVFSYSTLSRLIKNDSSFYGIQSLKNKSQKVDTIEMMAKRYIDSVKSVKQKGPYILGGWSMGGFIAYEMAQQLVTSGEEVSTVIMLDSVQGKLGSESSGDQGRTESLMIFAFDLGIPREVLDVETLQNQTVDESISYFYKVGNETGILPRSLTLSDFKERFELFNVNMEALFKYEPKPYNGRVLRMEAKELTMDVKQIDWNGLVSDLESIEVEGNHFTVLRNPHVKYISEIISREINS